MQGFHRIPKDSKLFQDGENSGLWIPSKNECIYQVSSKRSDQGYQEASFGKFGYNALLGYKIDGKIVYLCGGAVINAKYILTAAQCHVENQRPIT